MNGLCRLGEGAFPRSAPDDDRAVGAQQTCRVSIVTPCYNGAPYIESSLSRLLAHLRENRAVIGSHEVILVDDGSTDHTVEIVAAAFPDVKTIRHPARRGKGAAVRTGVLAAAGSFIFFIDADIPYNLSALEGMIDYLDHKEFHLCVGTRSRRPTPTLLKRSLPRRVASVIFTAFVSRIVVTGIRDTQCGFKGFRARVAKHLFSQGRIDDFAFDVEILYLAFKNDLDIKKFPVSLEQDDNSSVSLLRHGPAMLLSILQLPLRYHTGGYELMAKHGAGEDST